MKTHYDRSPLAMLADIRPLRLLLPLSVAGFLGCSSKSSPTSPTVAPAEVTAFSRLTNLTAVEVSVAGSSGWGIVDTGDPATELSPQTFPTVPASGNFDTVPAITLGATTVHDVSAIGSAAGLASPDPSLPLSANLGYTTLAKQVAAFNYRDVTFFLGGAAPSPPSGLLPESVVDFNLEGGGVSPASRIMVNVAIEGVDYLMLFDTGATLVTVSQSVFSAITGDGRSVLQGGAAETTEGMAASQLTRVASISMGGANVGSVVIAHNSDFDTIIEGVTKDIGRPYAGSLGGSFLNQFYVTIDYGGSKLHLAPYEDTSFVLDPAHTIGVVFGNQASGGGYPVASVVAGSDAESKGVSVGDIVLAVDGQRLAGESPFEASLVLSGVVGTTKSVQFGAAKSLANKTISLPVQEFLPLATETSDGGATDSGDAG